MRAVDGWDSVTWERVSVGRQLMKPGDGRAGAMIVGFKTDAKVARQEIVEFNLFEILQWDSRSRAPVLVHEQARMFLDVWLSGAHGLSADLKSACKMRIWNRRCTTSVNKWVIWAWNDRVCWVRRWSATTTILVIRSWLRFVCLLAGSEAVQPSNVDHLGRQAAGGWRINWWGSRDQTTVPLPHSDEKKTRESTAARQWACKVQHLRQPNLGKWVHWPPGTTWTVLSLCLPFST